MFSEEWQLNQRINCLGMMIILDCVDQISLLFLLIFICFLNDTREEIWGSLIHEELLCCPCNVCMHAKSLQLCPTFCRPVDYSPLGSSVNGILQQEYWNGVPNLLQRRRIRTQGLNPCHLCLLHWQPGSLPLAPPGKPNLIIASAKSLQLCLTLCDPIDSSPPGSPVPGILQVRTLE